MKTAFLPPTVTALLILVGCHVVEAKGPLPAEKDFQKKVKQLEWEPGLFEAELKKGKIVWLTFTADWCAVCQMNKARVFSDKRVTDQLDELEVIVIRADLTEKNAQIREALKKFGCDSVPTNVIGFAGRQNPVVILPEILNVQTVLKVLKEFEKPAEKD